ncbi:MAG: DEAD/DEAH box helicase [Patescibacteria group bacterium]
MSEESLPKLLNSLQESHKDQPNLGELISLSLVVYQNYIQLKKIETEIFLEISNHQKLVELKKSIDQEKYKDLHAIDVLKKQTSEDLPWTSTLSHIPNGMTPRASQERFLKSLPKILAEAKPGDELGIQMGVGSGKTWLFCLLTEMLPKSLNIAIVTPTIKLAIQTIQKLQEYYPDSADISFMFSHTSETLLKKFKKGQHGRIVVWVDESFRKESQDYNPDLIILDEAHLLRGKTFRSSLNKVVQRAKPLILSITATFYPFVGNKPEYGIPFLSPSGENVLWLDENKVPPGKLAYKDDPFQSMKDGEVVPIIQTSVKLDNILLDSSDYDQDTGEFKINENSTISASWKSVYSAFTEKYQSSPEMQARKKMFVVCPRSTAMAEEAAKFFHMQTGESLLVGTSRGNYKFEDGKQSKISNKKLFQLYETGEISKLFQIEQYREGTDVPDIDLIWIMAFLEVSAYIQSVGRGVRVSPEKENLMVVDAELSNQSKIRSANLFTSLGVLKPSEHQENEDYYKLDLRRKDNEINRKTKSEINYIQRDLNRDFYSTFTSPQEALEFINRNSDRYGMSSFEINLNEIITAYKKCAEKMNQEGITWETILLTPGNYPANIKDLWNLPTSEFKFIKFNPRILYFELKSYLETEFMPNKLRELRAKAQQNKNRDMQPTQERLKRKIPDSRLKLSEDQDKISESNISETDPISTLIEKVFAKKDISKAWSDIEESLFRGLDLDNISVIQTIKLDFILKLSTEQIAIAIHYNGVV